MGIFGFFRKKETGLYDGDDMYCKPPQYKKTISQDEEGVCKGCGEPFGNQTPNFCPNCGQAVKKN